MSTTDTLGDVRANHKFDEQALYTFLREADTGFAGEAALSQFGGGQSNPTFLITTPGKKYVLRKQPPGELMPSAHQVAREYRVMKALEKTDVPVPRMVACCQDKDVIGTDFYVMEFLDGRVLRDPQLPDLDPVHRAAVYEDLADVLARLHTVDVDAVGLSDFGRPGNYYERQIGRWIKQYRAAETEEVKTMEALIEFLPDRIPADDTVSIAHGDYRIENTVYQLNEPKMMAVLDWELCTIGHPFADLAYCSMLYHMDSPSMGTLMGVDFERTGIPSEDKFVADYCKRMGRDGIPDWEFYLAFSLFRLASISQGVYKRGIDGNASNPDAAKYGSACGMLSGVAWDIAQRLNN